MAEDLPSPSGEFLLYSGPDGRVKVECRFQDETLWLTQRLMADLFGVGVPAINKHLKNIFESGELDEAATISKMEMVRAEGDREVRRQVDFYNLDAIIAVGYRVNSYQATQFRIWATRTLKDFIIKGFVMDDERLKQGGSVFGKDYFEELLERIREIRASERRFYQKITDIYATAADYDPKAPITREFFATVQNKLHWAITGKTAAEQIHASADAERPHMGLTTWRNAPKGKILKSDVSVAKNYLSEKHIGELNRIISAYLDLAENRARRGIVTRMSEWVSFLNSFLELSNYPILQDAGKISAVEARLKAEAQFEVFRKRQDLEYRSDFDEEVRRIQGDAP
ncbi:MAG: virulence RhuM family protein [Verrucomicrobiae bacterium]|nr:virulence RhuM family protein [Verrucomicrobiae bacterium]